MRYRNQITAIVLGIITVLIGLIIASIVDAQAALSGDTAVRCTAAASNSPTFVLKTKSAAACTATGGLVNSDFVAPTPTSGQLTELNKSSSRASSTSISSFAGAKSMNDLLPLLIRVTVLMIGIAMIGIGGIGFAGRGPLRA